MCGVWWWWVGGWKPSSSWISREKNKQTHTHTHTESGRVFCMGANAFGQCGLGAGGTSSGTANEGAASLAGSAASATNVWTPLSPGKEGYLLGVGGYMGPCARDAKIGVTPNGKAHRLGLFITITYQSRASPTRRRTRWRRRAWGSNTPWCGRAAGGRLRGGRGSGASWGMARRRTIRVLSPSTCPRGRRRW